MDHSFFAGLVFERTTDADRAAGSVGRVYTADLGNGHTFEVIGSDGAYVNVRQTSGGAFGGETFRWHVSSLNGMRCDKH